MMKVGMVAELDYLYRLYLMMIVVVVLTLMVVSFVYAMMKILV
jgi:hypothetical protein